MTQRLIDDRGVMRTDSLFYERLTKKQRDKGVEAIWTIREYPRVIDGKTYPSFYQAYMKCVDDYDAGITLLGSSAHWKKLKAIKWFADGHKSIGGHRGYSHWPEDMFLRDASLAKKILIEKAKEGNTSSAVALAALLKATKASTKGRPKAEDIAQAAADIVEEDSAFAEDIKRLNVVKIR